MTLDCKLKLHRHREMYPDVDHTYFNYISFVQLKYKTYSILYPHTAIYNSVRTF